MKTGILSIVFESAFNLDRRTKRISDPQPRISFRLPGRCRTRVVVTVHRPERDGLVFHMVAVSLRHADVRSGCDVRDEVGRKARVA